MTGVARPLAVGVRTGVRWAAGAHYTGMAARLGVSLALARLLAPADFGVMALAMAVVGVLDLLQESGLGAAVIQYRGRLDRAAGAAFTLAATGGTLAALAVFMAAPVLATVVHQPRLEPVLRVLAVTCVVRGAAQTSRGLLQRAMAFRTLALIELGGTLVYGAVGLGLAFRGAGIWSLVAGQLACEALLATAVMLSCTPRPVPWRATRAAARELLAFGRPMMFANLCTLIRAQLPTFVAGRVLGATPLGLYAMAQRWASLPVTGITHVVGRVAYPALARLSDDRERLAAAWLRILGGVTTLATPAATCLAVVADPLVRTLYDDRWHPAIPALHVLAVYGGFQAAGATTGEVMKAAGAPRLVAWYGLLYTALLAAGLLVLAPAGTTGIAAALAAPAALITVASLATAARLVGTTTRSVAAVIGGPVAASAALAVVALAARRLVQAYGGPPAIELGAAVVAGGLSYAGALAWIAPRALSEVAALAGLRARPRPPIAAACAAEGG